MVSWAVNAMRPPQQFETQRLFFRSPTLEDAPAAFAAYACDPEVTRYLTWEAHTSVEKTLKFMRRCVACWEDGSAFPWVILTKADRQLIGTIELRLHGTHADLGYGISRSCWGQGYATEAAQAVVDWAYSQPGIYRVWTVCDVDNLASARVLEKVGLQKEGILRRWLVRPSFGPVPRDCYCYSKVK